MAKNSGIRLELLGAPRVLLDGESVGPFRTNRVPALLGYLAVSRGTPRRDRIADALWPHLSEEAGRHNLRQTLVYVRQLLGPGAILSDRTTLELGAFVSSDVRDILDWDESPIDIVRGDALVRQARGAFLDGSDDEWMIEPRERLAQCHVSLLIALSDVAIDAQPGLALEYSASAIRIEPLQDGARARKIRALRRLGEDAAAEKEYADFARLLRSELRIEPAEMVRAALEEPVRPGALVAESEPEEPLFESKVVDGLIASGRPDQAIDLVAALVPHWIATGQSRAGIELLRQVLTATHLAEERHNLGLVAMAELWIALGVFGEGSALLDRIVAESASRTVKCRAYHALARIALYRYRSEKALAAAEEALRLSREKALPYMTISALRTAALAAGQLGEVGLCESFANEAISLAENLDVPNAKAWGIFTLGEIRAHNGDAAGAHDSLERLQQLSSRLPDSQRLTIMCSASRLREEIGDLEQAEAGYRECIHLAANLKNAVTRAIALTYLGDLQTELGDFAGAAETHHEAIAIRLPNEDTLGLATSRRGLGRALLALGDLRGAKEALAESARGFVEADATPGYASALLLLARVEELVGDRDGAIRLARRSQRLIQGLPPHQTRSIGPSGGSILFEVTAFLAQLNEG